MASKGRYSPPCRPGYPRRRVFFQKTERGEYFRLTLTYNGRSTVDESLTLKLTDSALSTVSEIFLDVEQENRKSIATSTIITIEITLPKVGRPLTKLKRERSFSFITIYANYVSRKIGMCVDEVTKFGVTLEASNVRRCTGIRKTNKDAFADFSTIIGELFAD